MEEKKDRRVTHGRSRPRFGSKRWWDYHRVAPLFFKCMRCGVVLLNPMSTLTGAGHVCEKQIDIKIKSQL